MDIQTLDKAAALPIATATRVMDLRQYINSNPAYSNLKFLVLCTNKQPVSAAIASCNKNKESRYTDQLIAICSDEAYSGWKDEDVNTSRSRTKTFRKEDDEDDLNEGFYLSLLRDR